MREIWVSSISFLCILRQFVKLVSCGNLSFSAQLISFLCLHQTPHQTQTYSYILASCYSFKLSYNPILHVYIFMNLSNMTRKLISDQQEPSDLVPSTPSKKRSSHPHCFLRYTLSCLTHYLGWFDSYCDKCSVTIYEYATCLNAPLL